MRGRTLRDRAALAVHRARAAARSVAGVLKSRLDDVRGADAILMYHRVLPDGEDVASIDPGMYVRASTFERHLDVVQSRWTVGVLSGVLAQRNDDRPRVAVTFDDGWRDNLEVAWPILRARGVRATIFLVTNWCEAGANADGRFMLPSEVRDLARQGMEFGAHTVSHPRLDLVDTDRAREEMAGSRESVAAWTERPCPWFAYPFGRRTVDVEQVAASLFAASVVVGGGWWKRGGDRARVPRIAIHDDMTVTRALFEERLADAIEVTS